jgi:hypothetical protein
MGCNGFDDDLYNRAGTLCESSDSTESHEGAHSALYANHAAPQRAPGPASLAAAAGCDRLRLFRREFPRQHAHAPRDAFQLAWYALLLRLTGKSERTLQTTTAVFGFQAVLSPLLVISEWLMRRFAQDTTWQFPVTLMGLVLVIWVIAANSHVVKAALEWSSPASVALVILQILAGQILLFALFPAST